VLGYSEPARKERLPGGEVEASQCIWDWLGTEFTAPTRSHSDSCFQYRETAGKSSLRGPGERLPWRMDAGKMAELACVPGPMGGSGDYCW
jgi:hypothetical protein